MPSQAMTVKFANRDNDPLEQLANAAGEAEFKTGLESPFEPFRRWPDNGISAFELAHKEIASAIRPGDDMDQCAMARLAVVSDGHAGAPRFRATLERMP
jgi:hypothetical protein